MILNLSDPRPVTRDDLPSLHPEEWSEWRKKVPVRAIKVAGPFTVATSEGELSCADGYLAVDARGYPYPIATEEFELIYDPVAQGEAL